MSQWKNHVLFQLGTFSFWIVFFVFMPEHALEIADYVDLEVPEYLAPEIVVLVYMKPDPECYYCFRAILPLHCRYHQPAEADGKISAILKSPEYWSIARNVNQELELQIPVGLKDHVTLVCTGTLVTTILCSSLILSVLFTHGEFLFVQSSL